MSAGFIEAFLNHRGTEGTEGTEAAVAPFLRALCASVVYSSASARFLNSRQPNTNDFARAFPTYYQTD